LLLFFAAFALGGCRKGEAPSEEWNRYCTANKHDVAKSSAKLSEPLVASARAKLAAFPDAAPYEVPLATRRFYGLHGERPVQFLDALCSEYRDNAPLLAAKLRVLSEAVAVPEDRPQRYAPGLPLWPQLTAEGYRNLALLTHALANYQQGKKKNPLIISACEFRFIFKEYLARYRAVLTDEDFREYVKERTAFLKQAVPAGECSAEETASFYAFRGFSTLAPGDPEAGTMYQLENATALHCGKTRSMLSALFSKSLSCDDYFAGPDALRRAISMQILRRILMYRREDEAALKQYDNPIVVTEDLDGDGAGEMIIKDPAPQSDSVPDLFEVMYGQDMKGPNKFRFSRATPLLDSIISHGAGSGMKYVTASEWKKDDAQSPDLGLRRMYSLKTPEGREALRDRLAVLIQRHSRTYDLALYFSAFQALYAPTSPLLAASSLFSEANRFALPGHTVYRKREQNLGWVYVFRIKNGNRYSSDDISAQQTPDFTRQWLENWSLVTQEPELDRFGEPDPDELEALLFLGNVDVPPELRVL
jgi:hypothetical protein